MLTTSDNDHEALNSIKFANKILKKENITWETFFGGPTSQNHSSYKFNEDDWDPKPSYDSGYHDQQNIPLRQVFDFIRSNAWDGFNFDFIDSLELQFVTRGRLSPKQRAALMKIYNKMQDR